MNIKLEVEKEELKQAVAHYADLFPRIIINPAGIHHKAVTCMTNVIHILEINDWNMREAQYIDYNIEALYYLTIKNEKIKESKTKADRMQAEDDLNEFMANEYCKDLHEHFK